MKPSRKLLWVLVPVILLVTLPLPVASRLEENDAFCIACHTAPEEAYYQRAQAALAGEPFYHEDLVTEHYAGEEPIRCIDCHRGDDSPADRVTTFLLGTRDALKFFSGRGDDTLEKLTAGDPELINRGCTQCHAKTLVEMGFNKHFHNQLPAAKTAAAASGIEPFFPPDAPGGDPFPEIGAADTAISCIDCHQGHRTLLDGAFTLYLDVENVVYTACVQCHIDTGHGPLDLAP